MAETIGRRSFLGTGASAAGAFAASGAGAAPRLSYKRRSPASPDLVKVGVVLGRFTHTKNIWYRFTNPLPGEPRRTGMIVTHYWTFCDDVVEDFENKTGAQRVRDLDGLIGNVDGVIVDESHATSLQHLAAIPYLESGVPTFVNRPFSSSAASARAHDRNGPPKRNAPHVRLLLRIPQGSEGGETVRRPGSGEGLRGL